MRIVRFIGSVILATSFAVYGAEPPVEGGIGVVLGVEGQQVIIKRILPDSPAAAQRELRVGDRILAVAQDNEPAWQVESGKLAQTLRLIRGPKGTTVRLTVLSAGEDESRARLVSIVRGEVKALSAWGDGRLLDKGMMTPDIEMVGLADRKAERLSQYAGKIIVLEFWATWCEPCQPKVAELQACCEKHPEWRDKVVLITASVDDSETMPLRHLEARGWLRTHNVWVGADAKKAFHLDAIPTAYVIDRQGKIAAANPHDLQDVVKRQLEGK